MKIARQMQKINEDEFRFPEFISMLYDTLRYSIPFHHDAQGSLERLDKPSTLEYYGGEDADSKKNKVGDRKS
jgi:hypothetical protein